MYMCKYIGICVYLSLSVYIYIYIHIKHINSTYNSKHINTYE